MARLLVLLAAFSVLCWSAQAYTVYDVYCSEDSCDACQSVCDSFCTGLYQLDDATCYAYFTDGDFDYNSVNCYCEFNASGWTLVLFFPTLVVLWIIVALVLGGLLLRRTVIKRYDAKYPEEMTSESVVMYRALPTQCQRWVGCLVSVMTCGFLLPFLVVRALHRFYERFWMGGLQGEFHGDAGDYCLHVFCVNNILSCFTCGLWVCCDCAAEREARWIDANTSVRGAPHLHGQESVHLWRARPSWGRRVLTNVLTCLTCGLVAPLLFARNLKTTLAQVHFGGKRVQFTSHTDEYVNQVWGPRVLYNLVTCGCYGLCGCAEVAERGFVDIHLAAVGDALVPVPSSTTPWSPGVNEESHLHAQLSHLSSPVPYAPQQEQTPLLGDKPPPYQYGAPRPY